METALPHLSVVIICGQTDDKLWPLVHSGTPRETVTFPLEQENLLEATVRRCAPLSDSPLILMCRPEIAGAIEKSISSSKIALQQGFEIILEPLFRGSAFTIALAAALLKQRNPNALMLVTPSHLSLEEDDRWDQAITRACKAAEAGMISLIGHQAKTNSADQCMLRPALEIRGIPGVKQVSDLEFSTSGAQAKRYESLGFVSNTGIMVMRAATALSQLRYVARYTDLAAGESMDRVAETANFLASVNQDRWQSDEAHELVESLPKRSFEDTVLAACHDLAVVPTSLDFKSFTTLKGMDDTIKADEYGNRIVGRAFAVDSLNTTIFDEDKLTVVLGLEDVMVVNTRDSVLVSSKDSLDSLSEIVPVLKEAGAKEVVKSSVSKYGWGTATVLFSNKTSRVRLIRLLGEQTIPDYKRENVEEIWTLLSGRAIMHTKGSKKTLNPGDQMRFSRKERHSIYNPEEDTACLICLEIAKASKNKNQ